MASDEGKVAKAAEKAAGEIVKASDATAAGCEPFEAAEENIGDGPADLVGELEEFDVAERNRPKHNQSHVILSFDGHPVLKFKLSKSGNVLVPLVDREIEPLIGARTQDDSGRTIPEKRKSRDQMAKSGNEAEKLAKLAAKIQSSLKYPASTAPEIQKVFTPSSSLLVAVPMLIQIGAHCWLRWQRTKRP